MLWWGWDTGGLDCVAVEEGTAGYCVVAFVAVAVGGGVVVVVVVVVSGGGLNIPRFRPPRKSTATKILTDTPVVADPPALAAQDDSPASLGPTKFSEDRSDDDDSLCSSPSPPPPPSLLQHPRVPLAEGQHAAMHAPRRLEALEERKEARAGRPPGRSREKL